MFPFAVAWAGLPDFSGSIVSKAHGLNSNKLPATVDNTVMYELMYMLPKGTTGFHVTAAIDASESSPARRPTTNLIDLAKSLGYTVVYTEDQMNQAVNSAKPPEKLLGVFAAIHTFDDRTEEALGLNTANPLPLYVATAPTVGEMLEASLKILKRDPDGFFVVIEEEGTDNFANNNNVAGTVEAVRRTDAAIGVAKNYIDTQDPNTLLITAADFVFA